MQHYVLRPNTTYVVNECLARPIQGDITLTRNDVTSKYKVGDFVLLSIPTPGEIRMEFLSKQDFQKLFVKSDNTTVETTDIYNQLAHNTLNNSERNTVSNEVSDSTVRAAAVSDNGSSSRRIDPFRQFKSNESAAHRAKADKRSSKQGINTTPTTRDRLPFGGAKNAESTAGNKVSLKQSRVER